MSGAPGDQDSGKWRRRALLLCLIFLLLVALFASVYYHRQVRGYSDQAIRAARQLVQADVQIRRAFGNPAQVGERPKTGDDGDYTFEVTGPSGTGEVDVQVRQTQGGWEHKVTKVRGGKTGDTGTGLGDGSGNDGETIATSEDPNSPNGTTSDGDKTTDAGETFDNSTIRFSGGKYSKIIKAVEKVVGKGRVRASTRFPPGGPAWTCVTVDGPERVFLMDSAWTIDDFPVLRDAGFQPVRGPSTKTLSIYGSVTASAMNFREERGDRVIVLVCPKSDWETLKVPWPK